VGQPHANALFGPPLESFLKIHVKTQRAMGHKTINSTVAYLSLVEDEIDQAILAS
jgi:hypothetical protein